MSAKRLILVTILSLSSAAAAHAALTTSGSGTDGRGLFSEVRSATVQAAPSSQEDASHRNPVQNASGLREVFSRQIERECLATSVLTGESPWADPAGDGTRSPCALPTDVEQAGNPRTESGREPQVTEIPPPPGSATLILSAFISVGGWQLGRSARAHVHFGMLPDWYHAEAPDQIGHTYAIDLAFDVSLMPVCLFDVPADSTAQLHLFPRWDGSLHRLISQQILSVTAPRGPPTLS